jgi:hypothetical protein
MLLTSPNVIAALRSRRYGQNRSYLAGGVGLGAFDGRDKARGGALATTAKGLTLPASTDTAWR